MAAYVHGPFQECVESADLCGHALLVTAAPHVWSAPSTWGSFLQALEDPLCMLVRSDTGAEGWKVSHQGLVLCHFQHPPDSTKLGSVDFATAFHQSNTLLRDLKTCLPGLCMPHAKSLQVWGFSGGLTAGLEAGQAVAQSEVPPQQTLESRI